MNKKSAQKQKRHLKNNGFSQAVVPPKSNYQNSKPNEKSNNQKRPATRKRVFTFIHRPINNAVMQRIQSILTNGSTNSLIEIEYQLSNGLPTMVIVGLGSRSVDESNEKIRSAFASSKLQLPRKA